MFVKDRRRCWLVRLGDVRFFESQGNYTQLHFAGEKPPINRSLSYLEKRLDPAQFFRVNRQHIVNLECVEGVSDWFDGKVRLQPEAGREVDMSRRHAKATREHMEL